MPFSKTWIYQACMFKSASLFIGTSFTVAVFTIFATSNVDSIVGIRPPPPPPPPPNIFNAKNIDPHKKRISLLNVPICTQGMQWTWWPEAGTIIVTGPYWSGVRWALMRLIYSPSFPLFVQQLIQVDNNETIKKSINGPLCREYTDSQWVPT